MVTPGTAGLGIGTSSDRSSSIKYNGSTGHATSITYCKRYSKLPGIRKPGVSQETARVLAGAENSNLPNHDITPPVEPPTVKPTSDPNSPISAPTRPVPKEPAITSP